MDWHRRSGGWGGEWTRIVTRTSRPGDMNVFGARVVGGCLAREGEQGWLSLRGCRCSLSSLSDGVITGAPTASNRPTSARSRDEFVHVVGTAGRDQPRHCVVPVVRGGIVRAVFHASAERTRPPRCAECASTVQASCVEYSIEFPTIPVRRHTSASSPRSVGGYMRE